MVDGKSELIVNDKPCVMVGESKVTQDVVKLIKADA